MDCEWELDYPFFLQNGDRQLAVHRDGPATTTLSPPPRRLQLQQPLDVKSPHAPGAHCNRTSPSFIDTLALGLSSPTESYIFTTKDHHLLDPLGPNARPCPYCGKTFQGTWHLRRHLRTHTGERPYCCPHCPYRATQSGDLKRHVMGMHQEQPLNIE